MKLFWWVVVIGLNYGFGLCFFVFWFAFVGVEMNWQWLVTEKKMESDLGKLFIGGISWDTDEERLKDYFRIYGEVVEAVIMRDRATGRARGFGFVVFADPAVAERVIMDKHMIDGRTVSVVVSVLFHCLDWSEFCCIKCWF